MNDLPENDDSQYLYVDGGFSGGSASLRPILPCPDPINWMLDSVSSNKCLMSG